MNRNYLFCYGTLKRGGRNDSLLTGCEFVGSGRALGCILLDMGGCPGMLPGKVNHGNHDDDAIGEVYSVSNERLPALLQKLDHLENAGSTYIRVKIQVELCTSIVECITYFFMPNLNANTFVRGGEWNQIPTDDYYR